MLLHTQGSMDKTDIIFMVELSICCVLVLSFSFLSFFLLFIYLYMVNKFTDLIPSLNIIIFKVL